MGARKPVAPEVRQAVLDAIAAGGKCREIAREHGVSPAFVSKLAKELPGDAFDRAVTGKAAVARRFDAKAAREQAVEQLYGDFQKFRDRAWSPYTVPQGVGASGEWVTTQLPPLRDQQAAYIAAAIALDKAIMLERHDSTGGSEAGKTMVNDLFGALGMAYHRIVAEEKALDAVTGREVTKAEQDAAQRDAVHKAQRGTQ